MSTPPTTLIDRRRFLHGAGALAAASSLGLAGCAPKKSLTNSATVPALPFYDLPPTLLPIRAHEDRIFRITVCLRPFRAMGPRMDVEKLIGAPDKLVVHNYGHGGSGWSLSWGSAKFAVEKALTTPADSTGHRDIAVIGCGALGLTAAITAQRAGARVTIYAKERPPEVRSARATGSWTPDSRIASTAAPASFADTWEQMARTSWFMYQSYLGMPGNPIEYTDRYFLLDDSPARRARNTSARPANSTAPEFAQYMDRLSDISSRDVELPPGTHPFPTTHVYRNSALTFNVADYSRQLLNDFYIAGGRLETATFNTPQDLAALPQPTLINCTGYGARALWSDESIVPVRGQITWLIPQEGLHYGLYYNHLNVLARRDGIVLQHLNGEAEGWNDTNETPSLSEAHESVRILQELYSRMSPHPAT